MLNTIKLGSAALLALAFTLLIQSHFPAQAQQSLDAVKQQFVGNYELVSFISIDENGQETERDYIGRIMYDEYGNMAAQGMPRDLPERARASDENVQAGFAYWGPVSFDLENNVVIHHVEGSPTRGSWPGNDNVRYFELQDGYLILSVKNAAGRTTGRLTWRKFR